MLELCIIVSAAQLGGWGMPAEYTSVVQLICDCGLCISPCFLKLGQARQRSPCLVNLVLQLGEHGEGSACGTMGVKYRTIRCQRVHRDGE